MLLSIIVVVIPGVAVSRMAVSQRTTALALKVMVAIIRMVMTLMRSRPTPRPRLIPISRLEVAPVASSGPGLVVTL